MNDEVEFGLPRARPTRYLPFGSVCIVKRTVSPVKYVHATQVANFSRVCKRYRKPRFYPIETDVICASKTHDQTIGTSVGAWIKLKP